MVNIAPYLNAVFIEIANGGRSRRHSFHPSPGSPYRSFYDLPMARTTKRRPALPVRRVSGAMRICPLELLTQNAGSWSETWD